MLSAPLTILAVLVDDGGGPRVFGLSTLAEARRFLSLVAASLGILPPVEPGEVRAGPGGAVAYWEVSEGPVAVLTLSGPLRCSTHASPEDALAAVRGHAGPVAIVPVEPPGALLVAPAGIDERFCRICQDHPVDPPGGTCDACRR